MAPDSTSHVVAQIDEWYERAPEGLTIEESIDWVQYNSEIPCPRCGELLWVMRGLNAGDRGTYHLALCQNPACSFQAAD